MLLFVVIPLIELFILLQLGKLIGIFSTITVIVLTGIVGAFLVRKQGFNIWNRIQNKLNEGMIPEDELIDGVIVLAGGIFLITPGLLTDITGMLFIIPNSRLIFRNHIKQWVINRMNRNQFY